MSAHSDARGDDVTYADVPGADETSVIDPHWQEMRSGQVLPAIYLPPSMPGSHAPWLRVVALVVIGIFLAATAAGVCLTYGPPIFGF